MSSELVTIPVLSQDFLGWDVDGNSPQIHGGDGVHAGNDEEKAWADGTPLLDPTKTENDSSLVFLNQRKNMHYED